jgi:hypothetical protein
MALAAVLMGEKSSRLGRLSGAPVPQHLPSQRQRRKRARQRGALKGGYSKG